MGHCRRLSDYTGHSVSIKGTYTILFACTMYIFWYVSAANRFFQCQKLTNKIRKRKSFSRTWLGTFIRILTILLYCISTTHLALAFTVAYRSFAITEDADLVYNDLDLTKNAFNLVQMRLDATNVSTPLFSLVSVIPVDNVM